MSEENPGQSPEANPAPENKPDSTLSPTETVLRADHERAVADMLRYKQEARELKEREKQREEAALLAANDFKALHERSEQEKKELKERNEALTRSIVGEKKMGAIRAAAQSAGISPHSINDLSLLDTSSVNVTQSNSGALQVSGAETFIANLKVTRPNWFGAKPIGVNSNLPGVNNNLNQGLVTEAELLKLSNEATKSGDYTQYKAKTALYLQQQTKK